MTDNNLKKNNDTSVMLQSVTVNIILIRNYNKFYPRRIKYFAICFMNWDFQMTES